MNYLARKQHQLGMNPSTAQNRLVKDILFKLVTAAGHKCFVCGSAMSRETFSIEHKTPWLDSDDPAALFFDLDNIAFSHLTCNVSTRRMPTSRKYKHLTPDELREVKNAQVRARQQRAYTPEKRSARYKLTGN